MNEPSYKNKFDKPVFTVNHAAIHKNNNGLYELQLNDQYFEISEEMLKTLADITYMPDTAGLSIG